MNYDELKEGDRVLFDDDGDLVTGTLTWQEGTPDADRGLAVIGDRGGCHYGPEMFGVWVWPLSEVRAALDNL